MIAAIALRKWNPLQFPSLWVFEVRTNHPVELQFAAQAVFDRDEHVIVNSASSVPVENKRNGVKTFEAKGLSNQEIHSYLQSADGQKYITKLTLADPKASPVDILERAVGQVASGSTLPVTTSISTPLVKIVPVVKKPFPTFHHFSLQWKN
jgi:hypothetical protein